MALPVPFSRAVGAFALALCASGCATHPQGVLGPVASTAPGTSQVAMVVATTRLPSGSPTTLFSGLRSDDTSFADIAVSVPPDSARKVGAIQWPAKLPGDPAKDFVTRRARVVDRGDAIARVDALVGASKDRRVLVFVHGFNNRFEDAVYRYAQIVHDSKVDAVPVLFAWPSKGDVLQYGYDRESSTYSRDALERLLRDLSSDPRVGSVSILAHSMGNWLTLEALRQMAIRDGRVPAKIADVVMAAPDVDVDVFRGQVASMGPAKPRLTLLVSRDDKVLALSRDVWGGPRLGAADARSEPLRSQLAAEGVSVVDLTAAAKGDALGHDTFADNPAVSRLVGARLDGESFGERRQGLGDRIAAGANGGFSTLGDAAGLLVSAPFSVLDGDARAAYGDRLGNFGSLFGTGGGR